MCTYILMKILESSPSRYDRGIRILTMGRLDRAYDRLTSSIKKGQRVLDVGCGTGALTLRAAQKCAKVKGIDVNPQMLEIAQKRVSKAKLAENVKLFEAGVTELGNEETERYDVVMSGLCFSELTEDELNYALREIKRLLKPGGILLVADEAKPKKPIKRIIYWLVRFPLAIITYLITQTTTKAIKDLPEKLEKAGFILESVRFSKMEDFVEVVATKPKGEVK